MKKYILRTIGIVGALIFVPIFIFTFLDPAFIEKAGKSFIEWKVTKEANEKIDAFSIEETLTKSNTVSKFLNKVAIDKIKAIDKQLFGVKEQLKNDAPSIIAAQIAKMRNLDCECRKKWEEKLRSSLESRIFSLEMAKTRLIDFTQAKYMEIVKNLTLDVRIFVGSNSIIFLLMLAISFFKPVAIDHLFLPGSLMVISTAICSFFYIFEQNWIFTILYNDYTGFAYVGYLAIVFAILCDIVFNHARITTEIINGIFNAIGSALSVVPC